MAEVLVVVEASQAAGVKKVTLEMLTIARTLGDVSAVVLGGAGAAAQFAERLGVAAVTGARKLTVDGNKLTAERQTDEGYEVVTAATPAVVSVWDTINEPRYPSFKGIMAAKKKPVQTLSLADLGVAPAEVGFAGATSAVVESAKRPPRSAGVKITDEGTGGTQLVEYLATEKFV